jgi:mannan endo-1,4-beta-mannosidase
MTTRLILPLLFLAGYTSPPAPNAVTLDATSDTVPAQGPRPGGVMATRHDTILTAAGEPVVLRGVNEMFVWSDDPRGERILAEIARTGANAVRIVTTTDLSAADLDAVIGNAIEHGMIPIPECHSATGRWARLGACVDYWIGPGIVSVLKRHERWVLLNIANEAGDAEVTAAQFADGYARAITRLRDAGIRVPLVVDAADWGRDYRMLLDQWPVLNEADPLGSIIGSAHTYWIGTDEDRKAIYRDMIDRVTRGRIPFIIGEGPTPSGWDCTPSPYQWAMTEVDRAGIGWLAWSWGAVDNGDCNDPVRYDMTHGGRFGDWETVAGRLLAVDHPASIRATSVRPCSIPQAGDDCVGPAALATSALSDAAPSATAAAPPTPDSGPRAAAPLQADSAGPVVLVHGAWGGGWDWRPVDRMLTARGYDVYRVTLTGLGDRVHLVGPEVDLSTHIADVVNTILFEDLHDVVLLGHSYGGMVITGVADSIPERLEALIYLDAMLPRSGESVLDLAPGLDASEEVIVPAWVDAEDPYPRDVPHPAATLREPLELDGLPGAGVRAAYILTREPGQEPDAFQSAADRAVAMGWPVHEIGTGHNAQRTARDELVALIEQIASDAAP